MILSNYIKQKKKVINVIWNQNGAWTNHRLTWNHKTHHGPKLGRNHHCLPYSVRNFYISFENGYILMVIFYVTKLGKLWISLILGFITLSFHLWLKVLKGIVLAFEKKISKMWHALEACLIVLGVSALSIIGIIMKYNLTPAP